MPSISNQKNWLSRRRWDTDVVKKVIERGFLLGRRIWVKLYLNRRWMYYKLKKKTFANSNASYFSLNTRLKNSIVFENVIRITIYYSRWFFRPFFPLFVIEAVDCLSYLDRNFIRMLSNFYEYNLLQTFH